MIRMSWLIAPTLSNRALTMLLLIDSLIDSSIFSFKSQKPSRMTGF